MFHYYHGDTLQLIEYHNQLTKHIDAGSISNGSHWHVLVTNYYDKSFCF